MRNNNHNKSHSSNWVRAISPFSGFILAVALSGCSTISIPLGDSDGPASTAAIGSGVKVEQPLPKALAYSDAAVIGEVASKVAFDTVTSDSVDWVNGATGSVGTWKAGAQIASEASEDCREFGATVTSVSGVHRFSGVACRDERGNVAVKSLSDKPDPDDYGEEPASGG